jgi:NADH-quinone oxidoreductase subunit J
MSTFTLSTIPATPVAQIVFYLIAALILGAGILSVTTRRIFRSAIWLLFSLIGIAGLYFWLQLEFIAAVQVIVYVGGIVVLILFSVFLTQQAGQQMEKAPMPRTIAALLLVVLGFGMTFFLISQNGFEAVSTPFNWSMNRLGEKMMGTGEGGYALPFEVISILLLAAMIGCIVIAIKPKVSDK